MPQIFRMGEYHVHIAKGKPSENATKVLILFRNGLHILER